MDGTETEILAFLNTKGEIPPEAEVAKQAKKAEEEGKKNEIKEEMDSDDEEVDQAMLKRGELEG